MRGNPKATRTAGQRLTGGLLALGVAAGALAAAGCSVTETQVLPPSTVPGGGAETTTPSGVTGAGSKRVLFIRGASGTTGFLDKQAGVPTADDNVSDVSNGSLGQSNHGFADLAGQLLADGFQVTQVEEGLGGEPVDLAAADLDSFSVVVFGSNNATYSAEDAKVLEDYVRGGGSALFMADANWGSNWRESSDSDNALLRPYGLAVNQDNGTNPDRLEGDAILQPDHPVLRGVTELVGNGTSAISVTTVPAGVTLVPLVQAKAPVRRNTGDGIQPGPVQEAGANDFAVVAVTAGQGRVAALFDRDSFFNTNGGDGKTNLSDPGNKQLAQNLFRWLDSGT